MMVRSIEGGRWTATFRPRALARFFGTGFLALWLCVWAAGEAFALGVLLATLGVRGGHRLLQVMTSVGASLAPRLAEHVAWRELPGPEHAGPLVLGFIGAWLAIWTVAGLMAAHQVFRLHASEDRVAWDGAGVEVFRRLGPFRSRRAFRADQIEHVSLSRPDRALLIHTRRSTYALTEWGSRAERGAVRDEIRKALGRGARATPGNDGSGAPPGWAASAVADGGTLLVRDPAARGRRAAAAWGSTIALGAGAAFSWYRGYLDVSLGLGEGTGALAALLALGASAAFSVWLSLPGARLVVRRGAIELRPGRLSGRSSETLKKPKLSVEHTTDSDGDDWFELQARSGEQRRTIERRMNEPERVLRLARWLSEKSGAPLELGRGVEQDGEEDVSLAA